MEADSENQQRRAAVKRDRSAGTFAKNMKPSQLAQIIVRIIAISWFLHGVIQTVGIFATSIPQSPQPIFLASGVLAILLSFITWISAPLLARWMARGNDQEVMATTISFQQLLYSMFVGIGLYLAMGSIGSLINSLHFFLVLQASPESIPKGMEVSRYELSKSAITVAVGAALVVSAAHWSKRLSGN
jgi:hypothetical protein